MNDVIRFDLNPPEMDYIFAHVAGETAKSGKYPERSWETDKQYTQMKHIRALKSHLYKYEMGIDIDPESGLDTTEHLMWRAVAIAVNHMRGRTDLDDRPVNKIKESCAVENNSDALDLFYTPEYTKLLKEHKDKYKQNTINQIFNFKSSNDGNDNPPSAA